MKVGTDARIITAAQDSQVSQPIAKPNVSSGLSFYKRPFHKLDSCGWVYDANNNFVFQFESEFDENGDYAKVCLELQEKIIQSLNSENQKVIPELKLLLRDAIEIKNHGKHFILIRGWGNLTGIGGYNFSVEKASKIQDDFAAWIIYKLTGEVVTSNGC